MLIRRERQGAWREPATTTYIDEAGLPWLIEGSPTLLPWVSKLPAAVRANPEIRRQVAGQALAHAASVWQMSYEQDALHHETVSLEP
jgi:hypothetical protein